LLWRRIAAWSRPCSRHCRPNHPRTSLTWWSSSTMAPLLISSRRPTTERSNWATCRPSRSSDETLPSAATNSPKQGTRKSSDVMETSPDEADVMEAILSAGDKAAAFEKLIGELRPKLHRYAARMTGSVIDGEDVVQDALAKAVDAYSRDGGITRPQGWLFRIVHNEAMDFLRRRARQDGVKWHEDQEMIVDPAPTPEERFAAAASLRTFARLPV